MQNSSSLTVRATGGRLRVLESACQVAEAFDPATASPLPQFHHYQAIWDTGATNSVVTPRVVTECVLQPSGVTEVHAFNSSGTSDTYLVNVALPNNVLFCGVRVTRGSIAPGIDVLIGMDIITLGDFAITNRDGITVFSFCMPSRRCIDFVQEHQAQLRQQTPGFRGYKPPPPKKFGGKRKRPR